MATDLAWGAALTEDDLTTMSDDGHRYELVDGVLIVSPSLNLNHQRCVKSLVVLLEAACDAEHEVILAPFDVRFSRTTVLIPDLLVARASDPTLARLETAPVLAVEVLSTSTRRIDLGTKRMVYEAGGVRTYWVIDPEGPSPTVLQLEEGRFVERATVTGEETYEAKVPFPVTVVPRDWSIDRSAGASTKRAAGGAGDRRGGVGGRPRRCRTGRRWPGCRRPGW